MLEIIRVAVDELSRQVWQFAPRGDGWRGEITWRLVRYEHQSRVSTRHKFRTTEGESRYTAGRKWRDGGHFDIRVDRNGMKPSEIPLPDDVLAEATHKAKDMISVDWSLPDTTLTNGR